MAEPQTLDLPVADAPAVRKVFAIMAARGIPVADAGPDDPAGDAICAALDAARSRIPARYWQAEADHPQVVGWVEAIVGAARPGPGGVPGIARGGSLLLVGPTGRGKTHQAYGAVRALLSAGVRLRWQATTAADLYATLRPASGRDTERELQALARTPLLIVDDLGAAKASQWTEEITYRLVNHRYEHLLPTVITSNLPIGQLREQLGERVASRLAQMTERVVLAGPDRRRTAAA